MLKLILENNNNKVNEAETADIENINEVEGTETVVEPAAELPAPDPEIISKACVDSINHLIQQAWDLITEINSNIATIDYNCTDEVKKESIKDILNSAVDDITIDIGMFYKVVNLIDSKTDDLIDAGKNKADMIVSPDSEDSEEVETVEEEEKAEETDESASE